MLDVRPLDPFGWEVDLDVSAGVSDDEREELVRLYDAGHLLLFRRQDVSAADQVRIAAWFGPVLDEDNSGYVSRDPAIGGLGSSELAPHSDLACTPHPLLGLTLYAVDVVDGESSTRYIDAVAAARELPDHLRERARGREAMHLWPKDLARRQRSDDAPDDWPGATHPILMTHPRTGDEILYVNGHQTDRVVGFEPEASDDLIDALFAHLYDDRFAYEHRWRGGDLVAWDNLALQHARRPLTGDAPRTLRRVVIADQGYQELMPPELAAYYASG
jgi:taurine dioxygenase